MTLRRTSSFLLALLVPLAVAAPAGADTRPVVTAGTARVNHQFARDLAALSPDTPYRAYVHVRGGTPESRAALVTRHGLVAGHDFESVGATTAFGTIRAIAALRGEPSVSYLEGIPEIRALGDTARWATNVGVVQQAVGLGPYVDSGGNVLDGAGVGVAVIDSGVDGAHPDFAGRVARNFHVTCPTTPFLVNAMTGMCPLPVFSNLQRSDTKGHGTHVAGIAVGDGAASQGAYSGVASGATLFAYAINNGEVYSYVAEAMDHLRANYATFTPRIRVLNNSWGNAAGTPYDPLSVQSKLVAQLVGLGVTVVFAAGNGDATNNGGTGSDDRLSSMAKDPTPGVVTVANYDDTDLGIKNGAIDFTSSRGRIGFPHQYPDISAPGMFITSTCSPYLYDCGLGASLNWAPDYSLLSGTSMAAPHVAGIAAMLYQAGATTPAQVEDVLQDTALKFGTASTYEADPQNAGGTISFDKGAGLVDAQAALEAIGAAHLGSAEPTGTAALAIANPASGSSVTAGSSLTVDGTADDGYVAPPAFTAKTLVAGEANDVTGPGAIDVTDVSVIEQAGGLRYTVKVRNLTDMPAGGSFLVSQIVAGVERTTWLNISATAVTVSTSAMTATPTSIVRDAANNQFSFTLTWAALGNPAAGTPVHHFVLRSYLLVVHDLAPGGGTADHFARLRWAPPFGIRRPDLTAPSVSVTVEVDGGAATAATLSGSTPSYGWSTSVDTTGLALGAHTITVRLVLDGVEAVVATRSFDVV